LDSSLWDVADNAGNFPLEFAALFCATSSSLCMDRFQECVRLNTSLDGAKATSRLIGSLGHLALFNVLGVEFKEKFSEIWECALLVALKAGHLELVKLCWEKNGAPEFPLELWGSEDAIVLIGPDNFLTLELPGSDARDARYLALVKWLINERGVDPETFCSSTCIHQAALSGSHETLAYLGKLITAKGHDHFLDTKNSDGLTALHVACSTGWKECVELLVDARPSLVSIVGGDNWTAMRAALFDCQPEIVKCLLQHPEASLNCGIDGVKMHLRDALRSRVVFPLIKKAAISLLDPKDEADHTHYMECARMFGKKYVEIRKPGEGDQPEAREVLMDMMRQLLAAAQAKLHSPTPWSMLADIYGQMLIWHCRDTYAAAAFVCDPVGW
jgi:ankyrin repeat protein